MSRKAADTYTAAVTRLKALVGRLESSQVDVDELEAVVKESVELVTVCRARLRATQTSVDTLLAGLQEDGIIAPLQGAGAAVGASVSSSALYEPARASSTATGSADDELDPFADD